MKKKNIFAILLVLVMAFSMTACGSSASGAKYAAPSSSMDGAYIATQEVAYEARGINSYDADEEAAEWSNSAGTSETGNAPEKAPETDDIRTDKIVYSANVTLEATEFDKAVERVEQMVEEYGGFIESRSMRGNHYEYYAYGNARSRSADLRIRIPSKNFDAMLNGMNDIGNVPFSSTYAENISAQYYDTQARLEAYRKQEARLLEMVEIAETVEDLVTIEDRLTWTRYEIESLQSTMKNWDRQVSYSTISLTISEVTEYTPAPDLTFGEELKLAAKNGLESAKEFLKDITLWFTEALPTIIVLLPVVLIILLCTRKSRNRRKERRQAKRELKAKQKQERENLKKDLQTQAVNKEESEGLKE